MRKWSLTSVGTKPDSWAHVWFEEVVPFAGQHSHMVASIRKKGDQQRRRPSYLHCLPSATVAWMPPMPGSSRQLGCRTQVFHQTLLSLRLLSAVFWGCDMPRIHPPETRTGRSPGRQLLLTLPLGPRVSNLLIFLSPSPYFFLGLLMLHNQALFLSVKGRS